MDLNKKTKFALQSNAMFFETGTIVLACNCLPKEMTGYRFVRTSREIEKDEIVIGTVEFCEEVLNKNITPDYFPEFIQQQGYPKRKFWIQNEYPKPNIFCKPAHKYKIFGAHITNEYPTKGTIDSSYSYFCSEVVTFIDEWRYYVANGEVLFSAWYKGLDDIEKPAPKLEINFPENYCGAVDFGVKDNGEFDIIEAHHPFACGWYGRSSTPDCYIFLDWTKKSWYYLKTLK